MSDRSERLRQRRRQAKKKKQSDEPDDQSEPSKSSELSQPDKQSKPDEPDDDGDSSVKSEHVGTYMYLPPEQKKDLKHVFGRIKADYEYQYDEEFEKNRHFYPLLVQCGLESLDSWDISDVREMVEELELR